MASIEPFQLTAANGKRVTIRSAAVDDAQVLLQFAGDVLHESDNLLITPEEFNFTLEQEEAWVREHLEDDGAILFVADAEREIVGLLDVRHDRRLRSRHYVSFGISVRAAWRGMGVGSAMIRRLLDWAAAHPYIEKVGLSVFSTNAGAIALYERLGFREVGRSPRHFKLGPDKYADNVIMYRFVNPTAAADLSATSGEPMTTTAVEPDPGHA